MSNHLTKNPARKEITLELADHSLANAEATLIQEILKERNWNIKLAAKELDIARGTLYSKMKKYNIRRRHP